MDINLITPINFLGYGYVGLNIFKSLTKQSNVSLWIIGQGEAPPEEHALIKKGIENASFFNHLAPCLRVWHQFDMASMVGKGLHAGFPIFELDAFNELEKHQLKTLDKVFVTSSWAEHIVKEAGVDNTVVTPLGVDLLTFRPRDNVNLDPKTTHFLNIGKWEVRKGHDILVEAFNKAFEPKDNVHLIMNCFNPFLLKEGGDGNSVWTKLYKESKLGDKITVIPSRLSSQEDVSNLMNSVDAGVFPSRAEGWNLEALEMMACGKPIIITDYSAHTEFCNDKNSLLVKIYNTEPAYDGIWFKGQGNWGEINDDQLDQLVAHMRHVHKVKNGGGDLYNEEGVKTAQEFTWDNTADKIVKGLTHEGSRA